MPTVSSLCNRTLIRCDASISVGYGHLVRCLAIADALREKSYEVFFAMSGSELSHESVRAKNYFVHDLTAQIALVGEDTALIDLCELINIAVLVVDVRTSLSRDPLQQLADRGCTVVIIDDASERRLAASLAFYPPVPQFNKLKWSNFHGKCFIGWEWVVLRPQFEFIPLTSSFSVGVSSMHQKLTVFVSMGTSDLKKLLFPVLTSLESLAVIENVIVLVGGEYQSIRDLQTLSAQSSKNIEIHIGLSDPSPQMRRAHLAIVSFGMTAYELASLRVPSLYLCISDDHAESASALEKAFYGISLGYKSQINVSLIASNLFRALELQSSIRPHLDTCGASRIADAISCHRGDFPERCRSWDAF